MLRSLFLLTLIFAVKAHAMVDPIVRDWKAELTYAPQYYQHSQSGVGGNLKGSNFIFKNYQLNLKRRLGARAEIDLDFRESFFNFSANDVSQNVKMRDLSLGGNWRGVIFRLEQSETPFIFSSEDGLAKNLKGQFAQLGYRYKIPKKDFRIGGGYSHLLAAQMGSQNLKNISGHKIGLWGETWKGFDFLGIRGMMVWGRVFVESRTWQFASPEVEGNSKLQTNHAGFHLGYAKIF
jgi:hypothetical protein